MASERISELVGYVNRSGNCVNINDHRYRFANDLSQTEVARILFTSIYAMIIVLAVTGNACIIAAVVRNRSLHSVRNMFIASLSCSDLVVVMVSGYVTPTSIFTKVWTMGMAMCRLLPVVQGMSLTISTYTLMCIAVDRYILIVHPTRRPISLRQAIAAIAGVWTIAFSATLPQVGI